MTGRFLQRRVVWVPTWLGLVTFSIFTMFPLLWWAFKGETYLGASSQECADILVVEGWIGTEGVSAAKREFQTGRYRYIITSSGLSGDPWNPKRWNFALEAEKQLLGSGLRRDQVVAAIPRAVESHRTFESAAAVWRTLQLREIKPVALTVFTRGVHARRSRLVFERVFKSKLPIGVVAWQPVGLRDGAWWESSARATEMIKESVAFFFELLFNSGRQSNSPTESLPIETAPLSELPTGLRPASVSVPAGRQYAELETFYNFNGDGD